MEKELEEALNLYVEMRNEARIPFEQMSLAAQRVMLIHYQHVEWWSVDFIKWTKPVTDKENWKRDSYRLVMEEGVILVSEEKTESNGETAGFIKDEPLVVSNLDLDQARRIAQVCLDMHAALGIKWGDDPYNAIQKLQQKSELVYLASPFLHESEEVMEYRFRTVSRVAADLMCKGIHVFSPISHCYPLAKERDLPRGFEFWQEYDRKMLRLCTKVYVLMIDGWEKSKGVTNEIRIAYELGIPVEFILPNQVF